jgi:hypothetical protein
MLATCDSTKLLQGLVPGKKKQWKPLHRVGCQRREGDPSRSNQNQEVDEGHEWVIRPDPQSKTQIKNDACREQTPFA